jgi:enoyl-CoA hydratase
MADSAEIAVERRGQLGLITLNRPKALNALTFDMVVAVRSILDEWAFDHRVHTVALVGAGERGLCAGGDIVALYGLAKTGDFASAAEFWRAEYALNALIASYPKPYVAIMDGLVLGGGIGVSAHGSYRVVTERSQLGMPETGIGFVPDVGGTWLFSQMPGEFGTHLALTAATVGAGDAIALGLADYFVSASGIPRLLAELETLSAEEAIAAAAEPAPAAILVHTGGWLGEAYAGDSVSTITSRLAALSARLTNSSEVDAALAAISAKSPLALSVTLASLRRARHQPNLEAALVSEFRVTLRALQSPDFVEGVRAQMIDKDRDPHWLPATLAEVDDAQVEAFFAPFGPGESTDLRFP